MKKIGARQTAETRRIERLLAKHFPDHPPEFSPVAYRYNPASIRVRVVSQSFAGKDRVERSEMVFPLLKNGLPEETWQDIMIILLLAPEEVEDSIANLEFENPAPSSL
jgi:stress-induced morphogen